MKEYFILAIVYQCPANVIRETFLAIKDGIFAMLIMTPRGFELCFRLNEREQIREMYLYAFIDVPLNPPLYAYLAIW